MSSEMSTDGRMFRNNGRKMMSRLDESSVLITNNLPPGKMTNGCLVCCNAPSCCAICSLCPCCDDSEFLVLTRESSKYFHIRENSIEWNTPELIMREGNCCGVDPCIYDVQDKVNVVYFDNPMFGRLTNTTRVCNEFRTCLCGGKGQRMQISAPCCCGLAYRGTCPCPCVPICCPQAFFPCALRHVIYLEDAQQGIYKLKEALKAASQNTLYTENKPPTDGNDEVRKVEKIDRV